MREIKFRVFHAGIMHYGPVIFEGKTYGGLYGISFDGEAIFDDPLTGLVTGPWPPSYIRMQFTGLTDADGTEIYESDVVEWERPFGNGLARLTVEFNGGGFAVYDAPHMAWNALNEICGACKVVGNIYEEEK